MKAQQVKFHLKGEKGFLGGVLIDNRYLICGCCGGVYDLTEDIGSFNPEVRIDEYYDDWSDISDYIYS